MTCCAARTWGWNVAMKASYLGWSAQERAATISADFRLMTLNANWACSSSLAVKWMRAETGGGRATCVAYIWPTGCDGAAASTGGGWVAPGKDQQERAP